MYWLYRLLGILITLFFVNNTSSIDELVDITGAIGIAHYTFSLFFSKLIIRDYRQSFLNNYHLAIGLTSVFLTSVAVANLQIPEIYFYFGAHHILTEVYILNTKSINYSKTINIFRLALNSILYYGVLYSKQIDFNLFLIAILSAYFALIVFLFLAKKNKSENTVLLDIFLFETVGVITAIYMFGVWTYLPFILYHFLAWFFYPNLPINKKAIAGLFQIAFASVLYVTVYNVIQSKELDKFILDLFESFGYFHITYMFFLSEHNPQILLWLRGKILNLKNA